MIVWKILLLIIVVMALIILGLYATKIKTEVVETKRYFVLSQDHINKKNYVEISKEDFDDIEVKENISIYYFPEDCPKYTEGMYIKAKFNGMDRYFVPEKNTMIILDADHEWTKNPDGLLIWGKNNKLVSDKEPEVLIPEKQKPEKQNPEEEKLEEPEEPDEQKSKKSEESKETEEQKE